MVEYDGRYPGYGFAEHKGYAAPEHRAAILSLGVSPIHRRTFGSCIDVPLAEQTELWGAELDATPLE
jgi:ribonuclease HII